MATEQLGYSPAPPPTERRLNSGAAAFLLVEEETRESNSQGKPFSALTLESSLLLLLFPVLGLLLSLEVCLVELSVYVSVDAAGQQFPLQAIIFSKSSFMLEC